MTFAEILAKVIGLLLKFIVIKRRRGSAMKRNGSNDKGGKIGKNAGAARRNEGI